MPDMITLVCPPGSETAPISFDSFAFEARREVPGDASSQWVVDVPAHLVTHFVNGVAGFSRAHPAAVQPSPQPTRSGLIRMRHPDPTARSDGFEMDESGNHLVDPANVENMRAHGFYVAA